MTVLHRAKTRVVGNDCIFQNLRVRSLPRIPRLLTPGDVTSSWEIISFGREFCMGFS